MKRLAAILDKFAHLKKRFQFLIAALLGGGIGLGQAPWSQPLLAFVALFLAVLVFSHLQMWRQAALYGWAVGIGYFGATLFWIVEPFLVDAQLHGWMAPFALALMVGGMALFWALGFAMANKFGRTKTTRLIALIASLGLAELLRSYALTGFPWGLLGYMWLDTPFAQLAGFVGPHGLGAMALLITAALAIRPWIGVGLAVVLLVLSLAITPGEGIEQAEAKEVRLRLIQPNAPQDQKWDLRYVEKFYLRQLEFTAAKPDAPLDLIIWPEASVTFWLDDNLEAQQRISAAANGAIVVIGARRYQGRQFYNSLAVLDKTGLSSQVYDKRHLVPFGEYVPFGGLLSRIGIHGLASSEGGGFSSGTDAALLDFGRLGRALPLICYEASFPHLSRSSGVRPDWLLQLTNDAWFGSFAGPQQHLAQARMRAIEQGLPLVRVANTGVSAVIDANGKIVAQIGLGVAGYLDAVLPAANPVTFYSRTGDWAIFVLLLGMLMSALTPRLRKKH